MKTLHIPIYKGSYKTGIAIHTATIRNDWTGSDFEELDRTFPGCFVASKSTAGPLRFLKDLPFKQLEKYTVKPMFRMIPN